MYRCIHVICKYKNCLKSLSSTQELQSEFTISVVIASLKRLIPKKLQTLEAEATAEPVASLICEIT